MKINCIWYEQTLFQYIRCKEYLISYLKSIIYQFDNIVVEDQLIKQFYQVTIIFKQYHIREND